MNNTKKFKMKHKEEKKLSKNSAWINFAKDNQKDI